MILALLAGGCGILGDMIDQAISFQKSHSFLYAASAGLHYIDNLAIYALLMTAIVYSGFVRRSAKNTLTIVLPIPITILYPLTAEYPYYNIYDIFLMTCTFLYAVTASFLFFISAVKERNSWKRKERLITAIALIPTTMTGMMMGIFTSTEQMLHGGEYQLGSSYISNAVTSSAFVLIFIILIFRYQVSV